MFAFKKSQVFWLECSSCVFCALCVFEIGASTIIPPLVTKKAEEIEEALLKHAIMPDIIDKPPKHFLMALFRENNEMPELGNVLDPNVMQMHPYLLNWPCDNKSLYTLILTDPDAPSKRIPSMREWHHWLAVNIHVTIEEGNFLPDIFKSDVLSRYIPPYPKEGTGFHRYAFIAYKQPKGRIAFKEKYLSQEPHDIERANFSTRRFAQKYNLGDPIAVSFFLCQWVKPRPPTTLEPWFLPTDYLGDSGDLYPAI